MYFNVLNILINFAVHAFLNNWFKKKIVILYQIYLQCKRNSYRLSMVLYHGLYGT